MKPKIIFRADGNSVMGLGHLVRCGALVSILQEQFTCTWITRETSKVVLNLLYKHGQEVIILPELAHLAEADFIADKYLQEGIIVVVDGYGFDTNYQRCLLKKNIKLVCLDDLYSVEFLAHAIINHCGNISHAQYNAQDYTKFYLGPRYAILRKEFLETSGSNNAYSESNPIFINMGGADPENFTLKVIHHLGKHHTAVKDVNIVVGAAYLGMSALNEYVGAQSYYNIKIFQNLDGNAIAKLMAESSIGICAASGVSYEYCAIGRPLYLVMSASNQANTFQYLLIEGLAFDFFNTEILSFDLIRYNHMIIRQKSVFDGKSAGNLIKVFNLLQLEDQITFTLAKESDMLTYYNWANDSEVRNNSINRKQIELESHKVWFLEKIKSLSHRFYIFKLNGNNLGQVRLDNSEVTWINFSIDPAFRGQGLGEIILQKAMLSYKEEISVTCNFQALVLPGNKRSEGVFSKLGFSKVGIVAIQNQSFTKFEKII